MTDTFRIEKISRNLSEVKVLNETQGIVEAYVNSMGIIDSDNDIITSDAFDRSIENNLPIPVLTQHDQSNVVGKVLSASVVPVSEKEYRLKAVMQMNLETELGRDAFSNVKGDYLNQYSVGFNMTPESAIMERTADGQHVRIINNLDWIETSLVVRGASPSTATISAKSEDDVTPTIESEPVPDTSDDKPDASGTEVDVPDELIEAVKELRKTIQLREIEEIKKEIGEI
jgi:HK97 family phage prohead protease